MGRDYTTSDDESWWSFETVASFDRAAALGLAAGLIAAAQKALTEEVAS